MTTISLDNFWCPNKCLHDEQHSTYVCIRVSSVFSGTSRLLQNRVLYHRLFSVLDLSDVRRKRIVCTYIRGGPCVTPKDNANISCFKDFPSRSQRCWCISATRKNRRLSWCCCSESIPYVSECLFPHENFLMSLVQVEFTVHQIYQPFPKVMYPPESRHFLARQKSLSKSCKMLLYWYKVSRKRIAVRY